MNKKLISLIALITLLASCSKDDIFERDYLPEQGDISQNELCEMTFEAKMNMGQSDASTRVIVGDLVKSERKVLWEEGDMLSIFSDKAMTTNAKFTMKSGAGSQNATFSGSCVKGTKYFAIYPYDSRHQYVQTQRNVNIYWGGAQQKVRVGSFAKGTPMVCVATSQDGVPPLNFQNVCSFFSLTTDYYCQSIVLESADLTSLAAEKIMMNMTGEEPIMTTKNNQSNSVTITSETGEPLQPGTYYIAVIPTTLKLGFNLYFYSVGEEKKYYCYSQKEITLERSKILNLGTIPISQKFAKLSGSGTEEDPYLIKSFEDLVLMSEYINCGGLKTAHFKQTADIDCGGKTLTPIGSVTSNSINAFDGYYDGNKHSINNLKLDETVTTQLTAEGGNYECHVSALFAYVANATIYDLELNNIQPTRTTARSSEAERISAINSPFIGVTLNNGVSNNTKQSMIKNISVKGTECGLEQADGNIDRIVYGGLIGLTSSNVEISHCTAAKTVDNSINDVKTSILTVGGIVGQVSCSKSRLDNSNATNAHVHIDRCLNQQGLSFTADTECDSLRLGGILGYAGNDQRHANVYVTNCINDGDISISATTTETSTKMQIGGLVGFINTDGFTDKHPVIDNCINNGDIKGVKNVGGLLGKCNNAGTRLRHSANTGSIEAPYSGSFVGLANVVKDNLPSGAYYEVAVDMVDCLNFNTGCEKLIYCEKQPLLPRYGPWVRNSANCFDVTDPTKWPPLFNDSYDDTFCIPCVWEASTDSGSKLRFTDESFYQTSNY